MFGTLLRNRRRHSLNCGRRTGRRAGTLALSAVLVLLGRADSATAQPLGWALEVHQPWDYGVTDRLIVVNLNSGAEVARFEAPLGVSFGNGAVTPDGQHVYTANTNGRPVHVFHVSPSLGLT